MILVDRIFLINVKIIMIWLTSHDQTTTKSKLNPSTRSRYFKDPFCPVCFTMINHRDIYMHHLWKNNKTELDLCNTKANF